jgi:tetratricopeptide (TPR) repeat protein
MAELEEAINLDREALTELPRDRMPLDWASTQTNLGNARRTLGERASGTALLDEALSDFRGALEEGTRERVPLMWAQTQEKLALVHIAYFKKSREPRHLDEALDHVGGALEEYRKAKAAYYIERAERVRARILASRTGKF